MKNQLTLSDATIRSDVQGRYSLNDLHRASGGENRHRPSLWLENQQTQALIAEIDQSRNSCFEKNQALSIKKGGNNPGIYACKELVYSYAMWISPAFHLKVIRAYDDMVSGKPINQIEAAKAAASLAPALRRAALAFGLDKNAATLSANQAVARLTGVNLLQTLGQTHLEAERQDTLWFTPTELGKRIGVPARQFNLLLAEAGLQVNRAGRWEPLEAARDMLRLLDTGKTYGGTPVTQIKWSADVLDCIRTEAV